MRDDPAFGGFALAMFFATGEATGKHDTDGGALFREPVDLGNVLAFLDTLAYRDEAERLLGKIGHARAVFASGDVYRAAAIVREVHATCKLLGLARAAASLVRLGRKFSAGRQSGTVSPVRAAIRKILKRDPSLSAAKVWEAIAAKPPRGVTVRDNRVGRYIETTGHPDTGYRRFANLVAEERKPITG